MKELLDPASLQHTERLSPEPSWLFCPQSRLEPILLRAARARGADVRYVFIYFRAAWDEFIRGQESDAFLLENQDVRAAWRSSDATMANEQLERVLSLVLCR